MFSATHGSLLVSVLFHFRINKAIWPNALLWAALAFTIAGIAAVALDRERMLSYRGPWPTFTDRRLVAGQLIPAPAWTPNPLGGVTIVGSS